jgi:hypothetical protein
MIARGRTAAARALRSHWTLAALVFALLAVVHTWPLITEPGTLSRNDNGDAQLNEWILAWVAHQLPRHPLQLFEGNIFYPAKDVLAFSEPLIVPALMVAPALWLGASPVLAMNLAMLIGFALTGLATYALIYAWTRDRLAGITAGSLFAFNTHTLTRLPHVQALHAYGMPLSLLLADRLIAHPSPATAMLLGTCMAMMAYTSGYFVVFATVMIAVVLLVRTADWAGRFVRVAGMFGLAAATAGVLALPLIIPYRRVAVDQHMVRPLAEANLYSATFTGYLAASGRVHFETWSAGFFANPVDTFFPGRHRRPAVPAGDLACAAGPRRSDQGRDGLRDRSHRVRAVARTENAGVCVALRRVSADAGSARGRAVRRAVPAGHRAARRHGSRPPAPRLWRGRTARKHAMGDSGRNRGRFPRQPRGAASAVRVPALGRHPRDLQAARERAWSGRARRDAVLSAERGVRERRVCPELHGALAAADERLQRLHANDVP